MKPMDNRFVIRVTLLTGVAIGLYLGATLTVLAYAIL
ncbi:hypothetical protein LCGC14_1565500 [marine sediment metagenome]|uniref:Uncharacterized protein n=1 Tax=marine sediment metagenome TaxID=412755 RepID=A0A0F9L243_9ZZZZ